MTGRVLVSLDRDRHRGLTIASAVFLVGAVALRVVGVPTVDLHGPLHYLGIMDPLCGGTRATFLLLTGDTAAAARYNPLVFPLAAAVVCVLVRSGAGLVAGRWLEIRLPRRWRRVVVVILIAGMAALSVRQQWNADLLMQSWPVARS
ncbi:DUF2752 domain-containing protein [Amycolatopsis roodepoortensis]|uniref:DUF2752 domain-containing protein n=1 Tax=Amycolatopsis roodepoortensis TaxID=700274 RepID=UPI00214C01F6|nr:DUF2752 domain-containing protein [Amycolatopsis roodepoortensis]UUV29959.1 DUF2752 domain-containing protein [Amycolatopsis roodepoortensis]